MVSGVFLTLNSRRAAPDLVAVQSDETKCKTWTGDLFGADPCQQTVHGAAFASTACFLALAHDSFASWPVRQGNASAASYALALDILRMLQEPDSPSEDRA